MDDANKKFAVEMAARARELAAIGVQAKADQAWHESNRRETERKRRWERLGERAYAGCGIGIGLAALLFVCGIGSCIYQGVVVQPRKDAERQAQQQAAAAKEQATEDGMHLGMVVTDGYRNVRGDRGVALERCAPDSPCGRSHLSAIWKWAEGRMSAAERWRVDVFRVNGRDVRSTDAFYHAVDNAAGGKARLSLWIVDTGNKGHYFRDVTIDRSASGDVAAGAVPTGGTFFTVDGYRSSEQWRSPPYPPKQEPTAKPRSHPRPTPSLAIPYIGPRTDSNLRPLKFDKKGWPAPSQ